MRREHLRCLQDRVATALVRRDTACRKWPVGPREVGIVSEPTEMEADAQGAQDVMGDTQGKGKGSAIARTSLEGLCSYGSFWDGSHPLPGEPEPLPTCR